MTDPAQERMKSLEQRLAQEPQSPLFARLADCYLRAGRANDALRLCDDGLALYPFYTTAHLVKAKVLNQLGMTAEARHAYEVVQEFLPTNESVARLISSIKPAPEEQTEVVSSVEEALPAETAPAGELVVETPPIDENPQAVVEEIPAEEVGTFEEPLAAASEPVAEESVTEEPQVVEAAEPAPVAEDAFGFGEQPPAEAAPVAEDAFGFGEQPAAEPETEEPSAADKLGLALQPESQKSYSDFVSSLEETPVVAAEETPFGVERIEEPQVASEPEPVPEPQQEVPQYESPITTTPPAMAEPTPAPEPESLTIEANEWAEAFSQLQQPATETAEPVASAQAEEENPFAMFGTEQPVESVEGEPYEEFTARVRMELFGTEDSMTLEEYLAQTGAVETPHAEPDDIGDLAEKLKSSPRITPPVINFSEKEARTAGGPDAAGGSGFVTPTLAEIYVKQGWFDDAIKAYKALGTNKPAEKAKFDQRIAEIEEMKKSSK
jgi:tetratricopeptide (TPR) repeat protein